MRLNFSSLIDQLDVIEFDEDRIVQIVGVLVPLIKAEGDRASVTKALRSLELAPEVVEQLTDAVLTPEK
jgi:hypothetical protein